MSEPSTDPSSEKTSFQDVLRTERDAVAARRRALGIQDDQGELPDDDKLRMASTLPYSGVAFSGGGIRSASFSLGFTQALLRLGVFRQFDYMSTASGGGYLGTLISSLEQPAAKESADSKDGLASATPRALRSEQLLLTPPSAGDRQNPLVHELIHGGLYLNKPWAYFSHWFWGVLGVNFSALTLIVGGLSILAFLHRACDFPVVARILSGWGFDTDLMRAFFPCAFMLLVASIVSLGAFALHHVARTRYYRSLKPTQLVPRFARWCRRCGLTEQRLAGLQRFAMVAWLGSFGTGIALVVTTGQVDFSADLAGAQNQHVKQVSGTLDASSHNLQIFVLAVVLLGLLPYLRLGDLIRSGAGANRPGYERLIFRIASWMLLIGAPAVMFGMLASEDISGYNTKRHDRYALLPGHIVNWHRFWTQIERDALSDEKIDPSVAKPAEAAIAVDSTDAVALSRNRVAKDLWDSTQKVRDELRSSIAISSKGEMWNKSHSRMDRSLLGFGEFLKAMPYFFILQGPELPEIESLRKDSAKMSLDVLSAVNKWVVSDERLSKKSPMWKDIPLLEEKVSEVQLTKRDWDAKRAGLPGNWREYHNNQTKYEAACDQLAKTENGPSLLEFHRQERQKFWNELETYYDEHLFDEDTIFASTVLWHDQIWRLQFGACSLGLFLVFSLLLNKNWASMHRFYRERLAEQWLHKREPLPLSELKSHTAGAPYHLLGGSAFVFNGVNLLGRHAKAVEPTVPFVFSANYCGGKVAGFVRTSELLGDSFDLADAMAISGAAVTPTAVGNKLLTVLLYLTNSRLGQWLPNPRQAKPGKRPWWDYPAPLGVGLSLLFRFWQERRFLFVSDGGLHDNSGILSLLERRCRTIVAVDASADPQFLFTDLLRLVRLAHTVHGIRIEWLNDDLEQCPFAELTADAKGYSRRHFVVGRIHYPQRSQDMTGDCVGHIIYVKSTMTRDLPIALRGYKAENPSFPFDSTLDQFYLPRRFESYRELGWEIGCKVGNYLLKPGAGKDDVEAKKDINDAWLADWEPPETETVKPAAVTLDTVSELDPRSNVTTVRYVPRTESPAKDSPPR